MELRARWPASSHVPRRGDPVNGVAWAASIWSVFILLISWRERRLPPSERRINRETLAMVLALLGTHSIVGASDAEEILRNPVETERILRGSLAGAALLVVGPRLIRLLKENRTYGHRGLTALMIYLLVAGVTFLYSAAPVVTAAKVFELGAGLAVVAAITLHPDAPRRIRNAVGLMIGLEATLLVVAVVGFFALPIDFAQLQPRPGFVSEYTMGSPYAHSNALSSIGAVVGAYALAKVLEHPSDHRRPWWWLALVAFGMMGTILSSGRQGVVIWLVSALVLLFVHRRTLLFVGVVPLTVFVLVSYGDTIWTALLRNRPTTFASLTGRTHWWSAAVDAWIVHPWTGYGYGVGGRFVALESIGRGTTSNIHSGYFEALVGVGILGMLPLLYAVFKAGWWSVRALFRRFETHIAILVLSLALRTGVAQGFGAWLNFEFLLFAFLVVLADRSWIESRSIHNGHPPLLHPQLEVVGRQA